MTPQRVGVIPAPQLAALLTARTSATDAQEAYQAAVAEALKAGGSVREVARVTGLSTSTVQAWGRAHRAAWAVTHGPIPSPSVKVRHRCDNPPCCNPAHLELGSQKDNIADMKERGRERKSNRDTGNGNAKLTSEQVAEIRSRYVFRKVTHKMLAAEYGVNFSTIQKLLSE